MTEAAQQQELINTLKALNNAVVSIRLYPPNSPQISNAFERGYKSLKNHLRQKGAFTLALQDDDPVLCGHLLEAEIVQSISNLIVFRQLGHLQRDFFVIAPGLDRSRFKKILQLFSAKVDQIKEQGGGRALIKKFGLEQFFPETEKSAVIKPKQPDVSVSLASGGLGTIRKEFVDVLCGRERKAMIIAELQMALAHADGGAPILAATLKAVLAGSVRKGVFACSAVLEQVLGNCARLTVVQQLPPLLDRTARILLAELDVRMTMMLFVEELKSDVGSQFQMLLLTHVPLERFGEVILEIRQSLKSLRIAQSAAEDQIQILNSAESRLLETSKGKQYLGQEKAKSIIKAGERARRAKRAEAGVKALFKGSSEVLRSEEFNAHLPFIVQKMEADGLVKEVRVLLERLNKSFFDGDENLRERSIRSIAQLGENLVMEKNWSFVRILAEPMLFWLENSDKADLVYEKICEVLQLLMVDSWQRGDDQLGDSILSIFYQIRSGTLKRSDQVRHLIGRTQDKSIDHELLVYLLQECLAHSQDEQLSRRLILQGPLASQYLIESLMRADDTQNRIKILDLLTSGEQYLPPILMEKLTEPMPWYGKRNLLKLLSETGNVDHVEPIFQFLHHDDLRVQREAFVCLYKISGRKRKKVLLHALTEASETMKLQIVRALIPFADAEVAEGLNQLLEEHKYYSVEFRDTLLASACLALARCPYPDSEKVLLNFLEMKGKRSTRKIGANVWRTAADALKMVEDVYHGERQLKVKAGKLRKSAISQVGMVSKAGGTKKSITGLPEEKRIRELLEEEEKESAKAQLLELITKVARLRRFAHAEQLREWLIEIDPLALVDIIRAAEIIDEEKHSAVDREHLETWGGLFDALTTEEFSVFYHGLEHLHFRNEEVILKKGSSRKVLFFINAGRIKLFYPKKDADVLIKTLKRGQILGIRTFLNSSVWTVNAVALGYTEVSALEYETLLKWREEYPALEAKLQDFCNTYESASEALIAEGKERREFERHHVTADQRLAVTLLDRRERSTGVNANGDLLDISRGGLSFSMQISRKDNARLLLGRNLQITLPPEKTGVELVRFVGRIVAICTHHAMKNGYALHVVFDRPVDGDEMERLLQVL